MAGSLTAESTLGIRYFLPFPVFRFVELIRRRTNALTCTRNTNCGGRGYTPTGGFLGRNTKRPENGQFAGVLGNYRTTKGPNAADKISNNNNNNAFRSTRQSASTVCRRGLSVSEMARFQQLSGRVQFRRDERAPSHYTVARKTIVGRVRRTMFTHGIPDRK